MVAVEVDNRSGVVVEAEAAVELARRVLAAEGVEEGELGLHFVPPDEMRALKREHLGIDEATDVLSFPIDAREPRRRRSAHGGAGAGRSSAQPLLARFHLGAVVVPEQVQQAVDEGAAPRLADHLWTEHCVPELPGHARRKLLA